MTIAINSAQRDNLEYPDKPCIANNIKRKLQDKTRKDDAENSQQNLIH